MEWNHSLPEKSGVYRVRLASTLRFNDADLGMFAYFHAGVKRWGISSPSQNGAYIQRLSVNDVFVAQEKVWLEL